MGARIIPFGGYEMPVWYTSVSEEHAAVREAAGLFDATHMGVFEASGPYALAFLDTVTTNDVSTLAIGQSHYTYLLLPDGSVIDDLMVYRRGPKNITCWWSTPRTMIRIGPGLMPSIRASAD